MPKDRGDVRRRLREAALELFYERGYDRTTAAEIAASAGVTERTFFRYFPDKREVLFNEAELGPRMKNAIAAAPSALGPINVVVWAFQSLSPMFAENLPLAERGQAVIARTPALHERQLAKAASITQTISEALQERHIEPESAGLAALAGMAVVNHGLKTWGNDSSTPLPDHFSNVLTALKALL